MNLDPSLQRKVDYWATNEVFDADTKREIQSLIDAGNERELTDRFYRNLEFGTGGLRGILGAGSARMNLYNIRRATAAFAMEILEQSANKHSIGITYDSRKFSREFAETVAEVMAGYGIKSFITKELRPVPMLSFMVREYGCLGGVCITASHNPPDYNGYKVYWGTGSQIIPPYDQSVIARYNDLEDFSSIKSVSFQEGIESDLIQEVGEELDRQYFDRVAKLSIKPQGRDDFTIAFTPLHGTAGYPLKEVFKRFGFSKVHLVEEQAKPDGSFPTVEFPNPEDPNALKLAVELGQKVSADLVLGTDPDCDRIGIVYRDGAQFKFLNGNQIGCLLTHYVLSALKEEGRLPNDALVIKTVVTTQMQNKIAEFHGAHVDETLTGFKWICSLIEDYESGRKKPYRKFICGGEESYGFLMDSFVRDKDGVISCAIAAEMCAYYKSKGKTLGQVLDDLFRQFGVYQESLFTITMPGKQGADQIKAMMTKLREAPPTIIDGHQVDSMKDFLCDKSYQASETGYSEAGPVGLPASDVLQFKLEDGSTISMRPSGTEPKIKFYISVCEDIDSKASDSQLATVKDNCMQRTKRLQEVFVELAKE